MTERLFECSVGYRTVVILFIVLLCLSCQRTRAQQPTASLSVSADKINCGQIAHLKWSSTGAVAGQINGFGGVGPSGERDVQPKDDTTYTFTATGPGGTASASVTVKVNKAIEASFSISPAEVRYHKVGDKVDQQGSATLYWPAGADTCVLVSAISRVGVAGSTYAVHELN